MVVFGSIALFSLHVCEFCHSDSTPDSRQAYYSSLCSRLYRAFRAVQVALQAATSSHEFWLVVGTGGTLCCSGVDTRGHVSSVCCTLISFHVCAFCSFRVFIGEPFFVFSDSPGAPATLFA